MHRTTSEPERESVLQVSQPVAQRQDNRCSVPTPSPVASLHRAIGNQAIQRQARVGTPSSLSISASDSASEREAERVANRVVRMQEPVTGGTGVRRRRSETRIDRMCSRCQRRYRQGKPLNCPDCEANLQRRASDEASPTVDDNLEQIIRSARGGGRPLQDTTRSFFEPRFGREFGDVRVHTGSTADTAAQAVAADAFTIGRDIVFRSGAHAPGSRAGRRLIAHELTHVLQQSTRHASSGPPPVMRSVSSGNSSGGSSASSGSGGSASPFTSPAAGYRVCARPLQSILGGVANHAYIEASPYRYAIITRCTPTSGWDNVLMGTAATKTDRSPDPCGKSPTCVDCVPRPGVTDLDACFRSAYRAYSDPSLYKGLGPNSNTFAGTLARACCRNMSPKPSALGRVPGWSDPPAPPRRATCPTGPPTC